MIDQTVVTAQHEVAHALAYVHHGLDFKSLSMRSAEISVVARPVDTWVMATIALAGPVIDIRSLIRQDGEAGIQRMIDVWQDAIDYINDDMAYAQKGDLLQTGGMLPAALPWSWAFVQSNIVLIIELGSVLIERKKMNYAAFMTELDGRQTTFDIEAFEAALEKFNPYEESLAGVNRGVRRYQDDFLNTPSCPDDLTRMKLVTTWSNRLVWQCPRCNMTSDLPATRSTGSP